jgi:pimeloyl-ACP methyl ester carboxylesterase
MPPILFLHAAFSRGEHFAPWVRFFSAAGFECVAPTLPGHAPSDAELLGKLSISDYLESALAARHALTEPPIVIGHSMGGLLAQAVAAETACAGLVCLASVPPAILWPQLRALPALTRLMPAMLAGRAIRPSSETSLELVLNGLPDPEQRAIVASLGPDSGRAYRAMIFGRTRVSRGAVRCPVMCVSGEDDRIVSAAMSRSIAARYGADEMVVPGVGHWLVAPSVLATVGPRILNWLESKAVHR